MELGNHVGINKAANGKLDLNKSLPRTDLTGKLDSEQIFLKE